MGSENSSRGRFPGAGGISQEAADWMRRIALAAGLAAVSLFVFVAADRGMPDVDYFNDWEPLAQAGLLAAASLGYLIALRWPGPGGVIMVQAGLGLGLLAAVEYGTFTVILGGIACLFGGVFFLLAWARSGTPRVLAAFFVGAAALFAIGWYVADEIYTYYYGPTHPESSLERQPVDMVEWVWAGGVTDSEVVVAARLAEEQAEVRLLVSSEGGGETMRSQPAAATEESERIVKLAVSGLEADTAYSYAIEADGRVDQTREGEFRTFPAEAASFTFAFGSCARTGSNGAVFDTIRGHDPLFFLNAGDFHYENISSNDAGAFRDAYWEVLTSPAQSALYRSAPIAYVWDDHDYGGDNSDGTADSRPAARAVYRQAVPHYELPAGNGDAAVYQAFSAGRVRFIVTDTRSERTPASAADDGEKTMLGAEQKAWLKEELLAAGEEHELIVWVQPDPWIDGRTEGEDTWAGYDTERREIAAFIEENGIEDILMVSGDAHMLAIDDGTNSAGGFPVFHAAALDRIGARKGGPYSEGAYPDGGQFGLVTIEDDGGETIEVTLSGRNWRDEEVVGYSFAVSASG